MHHRLAAALAALLCAASGLAQAQDRTGDTATPAPPRLIVTVVVDQFSANLFNQYRSRWTAGLRRLSDEGLVSTNGYQTHGLTETCPGHSTVLTGMHPAQTGIPSNDWIDPATGEEVYCLAAPRNTLAHGRNSDNGPVGPDNIRASSLGDWLKAQRPDARVFAVSGKDRGAINLAGHHPDGAFWFTDGFGLTTYVEPGQDAARRLAPVEAFNRAFRRRQADAPHAWTYTRPQCRALEADWTIRGDVLHSRVPPARDKFDASPSLDEETLKAAAYLIDSQNLGQGPTTDLLGVSLSATDRIGHAYGSQGPEMCEQMHRLDAALGEFLTRLEAVSGGVILVLTADHGGSDFVERLAQRGYPHAHRISSAPLAEINADLQARFRLDAAPLQSGSSGLIVADGGQRRLPEPLRGEIIAAALPQLRVMPDIVFAEARDTLLTAPLPDSLQPEMLTLEQRMRLSAVDERSSDIIMVRAPNVTGGGRVGGNIAGHGTPWDYDRRVPIVFWKPQGTGQERFLPIRTIDIAPTLAAVVDIASPVVEGHALPLWD
nr:alkaline phosphatase family protein [uncultured Brevundimonas sp.]